ncbi:exosortase/archaeosortase family protein [Marinobacter xiaoshiensis]|uniref:Exosortase/archaeosortase family protein n=1 Tax=Marinobacter xiaoshiensis TaxID=3073652 RepID=A0ABU2HGS8_9GAMM|nr:exosortase/archaeosortase family protein [Marinobacter sp. F60267]MDS1309943.1 exosortase/archaeosortase family protein [Marinobacter sp. F60267]
MLRKTLNNLPLSRPYLVVTAIAVLIFYPTWIRLAQAWLEFEQVLAHGLATALIFIGLLLIHPPKSATNNTQLKPYHLIGAILLVVTALTWALLELVRIDTLAFLMLPAGVIATAWALLGLARTLSFLPYVLLLSLSLPVWADMVPALVDLASIVVGTWVSWFGMTALIEGNSITLPYGRLLIADGCSGIRYFAISILLAMMTSILNDYRWRDWLITLMIAMVIGLFANWVRITILVVVAYETDMQSDMLTDHETMGWVVYGLFVLPALYFSPVRKRISESTETKAKLGFQKIGIAAVITAIVLGPVALTITQPSNTTVSPWILELASATPASADNMPIPLTLPSTLTQQVWNSEGAWISLTQSQKTTTEEKLVPYLRPPFDHSLWQIQETYGPGLVRVRNILNRKQVIVGQWYQVGSYRAWTYSEAKLLQVLAMLKGEQRFALVTLQAECGQTECDRAIAKLDHQMPLINSRLTPSKQ